MNNLRYRALGLAMTTLMASCFTLMGAEESKQYVAFRMEGWKTVHLHDAQQAEQYINALKALNCEVKTAQHDGHTDVQSRTVLWKLLALDTQQQMDSWVAWLQQAGFEVLRGHPVPPEPNAAGEWVQYRLADWKAQHIHEVHKAAEAQVIFQALGCQTEKSQHDGHTDLKIRCSQWMQIGLPNHEAAQAWEKYLQQAGFETKHQH